MNTHDSMRQFKAGVFQALAHPTRIFIVESLGRDEMTVGKLCDTIGIAQSNASQHLAVLRHKHIVVSRKEGNQIFYRLRDPLLGEVMEKMRQYFLVHISKTMESLSEEEREVQAAGQNAL
jgi:DNA-binding transcriptional ArsR family regulator